MRKIFIYITHYNYIGIKNKLKKQMKNPYAMAHTYKHALTHARIHTNRLQTYNISFLRRVLKIDKNHIRGVLYFVSIFQLDWLKSNFKIKYP